jgi:hypothetical protein
VKGTPAIMKEITPEIVLALAQHLLGPMFWPVGAFAVLCLINLVWLVASDGRVARGELLFSIVTGIGGGSIAVWLMLALTRSTIADMSGAADWALLSGIWLGGAFGTAATAYAIVRPFRLTGATPRVSCAGIAPVRVAPSWPLRPFVAALILIAAGAFTYHTVVSGTIREEANRLLARAGHPASSHTNLPQAAEAPAWLVPSAHQSANHDDRGGAQ